MYFPIVWHKLTLLVKSQSQDLKASIFISEGTFSEINSFFCTFEIKEGMNVHGDGRRQGVIGLLDS